MSVVYVAAALVGGAGIIAALGLISVRMLTNMPPSFASSSEDWFYAEMNGLWWDEGICWPVRHG